jgi:rhamnosyltransferase
MTAGDRPAPFPRGGRRLVIYVVYDRRGGVEGFVPSVLEGIRPHADRIIAVVNGSLTEAGRRVLAPLVDEVVVRPNDGLDIWAQKTVLDLVGDDIARYDEVILTNDTWFGPVRPLGDVLARMDRRPLDFWGMNDHPPVAAGGPLVSAAVPFHLQSFWIAVRRRMFRSEAWRAYWRDLPVMPRYQDAVTLHELRFTDHFIQRGFAVDAAFPSAGYDTENPSFFEAEQLLVDGSPLLKRKPFHLWPPLTEHYSTIGRWTMATAVAHGIPLETMLSSLVRNSPLRDLHTDLGMLEVLPGAGVAADERPAPRVALIAQAESVDDARAALVCTAALPGVSDLIVTTTASHLVREMSAVLGQAERIDVRAQVRELPAGATGVAGALLVGCRDVVRERRHDVIVNLGSATEADTDDASRAFVELVRSPEHAAELLDLFVRYPGLGIVCSPPAAVGDVLSRGETDDARSRLEKLAASVGVSVPIDALALLAPGSSFAARPEALALLVDPEWDYEDVLAGGSADLLPLLPAYAAGELGFHTRTVLTAEYAAAAHTALEASVDAFRAVLPGSLPEKIDRLLRAGPVVRLTAMELTRIYARVHHARSLRWARGLARRFRAPGRPSDHR